MYFRNNNKKKDCYVTLFLLYCLTLFLSVRVSTNLRDNRTSSNLDNSAVQNKLHMTCLRITSYSASK